MPKEPATCWGGRSHNNLEFDVREVRFGLQIFVQDRCGVAAVPRLFDSHPRARTVVVTRQWSNYLLGNGLRPSSISALSVSGFAASS